MDLAIIKHILRLAGIRDLVVRFDDPNRQIVASFTQGGEQHQELISFTEFERIFTEGPVQAPAQPGAEDRPGQPGQPGALEPSKPVALELPAGAGTEAPSGPLIEETQPAGTK